MSRPRRRNSPVTLSEKWGVSIRQAIAIKKMRLKGDALAIMINQAKLGAEVVQGKRPARGKYVGGLAALGMQYGKRSRCVHGHEFSPENTFVLYGRRRCRACRKIRTDAALSDRLTQLAIAERMRS